MGIWGRGGVLGNAEEFGVQDGGRGWEALGGVPLQPSPLFFHTPHSSPHSPEFCLCNFAPGGRKAELPQNLGILRGSLGLRGISRGVLGSGLVVGGVEDP